MSRNVLVTGVSSGIGRALTRALVAHGDTVWGVARRKEKLMELEKEFPPGSFFFSACDVGREEAVASTLEAMRQRSFSPDVVVLNAGVNDTDLLPDYDHARYACVFQTNLFGVMLWVREFLPLFKRQRGGQFVAVSSLSAYLTHNRGAGYSASKAALSSTFGSLRKRYRKEGITFTTVHLGPVETPMWKRGWFPFILSDRAVARRIMKAMDRRESVVDYPFFMAFAARLSQVVLG